MGFPSGLTYLENFPPDTQAIGQGAQDIRNLTTMIAERLAAMTGTVAAAEGLGWESVFDNMLFVDSTTGRFYLINSGSFPEITTEVATGIFNQTSTSNPAIAALVAMIAAIPSSSPGPLVLPTGATVLTTPAQGDTTTKVATMAAILTQLSSSTIQVVAVSGGYIIKIPLTYTSLGVPSTYVTISFVTGATQGTGVQSSETVAYGITFTTLFGASVSTILTSGGADDVMYKVMGAPGSSSVTVERFNSNGNNVNSPTAPFVIAAGITS